MKTAVASIYLKDLRDKTRRGLEGRARAGYATGGVPFGYRLRKEIGPNGKPIGSRAEIDPAQAKIIRLIFSLYADGYSLAGVAKRLNADGAPPPRVYAKNRRHGWKDSTVRAILHNQKYVGRWTYNEREWRKVPGTNVRRYTHRPEADIIAHDLPHLRIVADGMWTAVETRLRAVSAHYTKTKGGKSKGRSLPGRSTPYLFSSLLWCGVCGAKMVISGGSGANEYYRCEAHNKRGTCKNDLSVREAVLRASLLDEIRHRLTSEDGIRHARKTIAERLGSLARESGSKRKEHRARLEKLETQIARLVDLIAEGERSTAVRDRLHALEREAATERRALVTAVTAVTTPIKLPTPKEMLRIVFDLERRLLADVTKGREELRRFFRGGRIDLIPQPGGFYIARSEILPLVLLNRLSPEETPGSVRYTGSGCAGPIRALDHAVFVDFEEVLVG